MTEEERIIKDAKNKAAEKAAKADFKKENPKTPIITRKEGKLLKKSLKK